MNQSQLAICLVLTALSMVIGGQSVADEALPHDSKEQSSYKDLSSCLMDKMKTLDEQTTIALLNKVCSRLVDKYAGGVDVLGDSEQQSRGKEELEKELESALEERLKREQATRDNPSVITPHKRNYFLPITYVDDPNELGFRASDNEAPLDNFEAKFQLSFKAPLADDIFKKNDVLFFGFTLQSFWQVYNSDISSPFRETNYQPEVFYGFMNDFKIGEWRNLVNIIGIEHQSNGRTQPLSKSWNRIYAQIVWERKDWVFMFKPWYRLPEKEKDDPLASDGDDNPDIHKYMGFFEFSSYYKWDDHTFSLMFRNNLDSDDNHGALQLEWTFPMGKRFKGYAQIFSGYGESLIDYDRSVTRAGIGVVLSDFF